MENLNTPNPIIIDGDVIYIGIYALDKVVKININDLSIPPADIVTGVSRPYSLALKDNILYISEFRGDKLSKINLADSNPVRSASNSVGISSPLGLEFFGYELYMALEGNNKIAKLDIRQPEPQLIDVTPADCPFEIEIIKDELYFMERFQGRVSKFNVTEANPTVSVGIVSTQFEYPSGLYTIYITDFFGGSLLKSNLSYLSVPEKNYGQDNTLLYPNPAKELITILNMPLKDYKIFDMIGNQEANSINVSQLAQGTYII